MFVTSSFKKMIQGSRVSISVVVLGLVAAILVGAAGMWYVESGDTTSVLAALVEQTPTPGPVFTVVPTPTAGTATPGGTKASKGLAAGLGGAFGTLESANGVVLAIQSAQGISRTLELNTISQLIVVGKPNATASDLAAGDKILALGVKKGTTDLMPRVLIAAPASYTKANILAGKIDSVSTNAITMTSAVTTESANFDANTQIFGPKLLKADASALKVGSNLLILGEPGASSFTAQAIITVAHVRGAQDKAQAKAQKQADKAQRKQTKVAGRAGKANSNLPGAFGAVSAVTANSLSVQPLAPRNFKLSASTRVIMVGKPNATASDIQTGDKVLVLNGAQSKDGGAAAVVVAPASYTLDNVAAGKVTSIDANSVTLDTAQGSLTVDSSNSTRLYGMGLAPVTLQDLQLNQKVLVLGTKSETSMEAQVLFGLPLKAKPAAQ